MRRRFDQTLFVAAGILALTAGAGQALATPWTQAQTPDRADVLLSPAADGGEPDHRADDARQDPEELRATRALNDEVLQRNLLAENQERADRAAFEAERARHEAEVARATQAQLAYEADLRQAEAARRRWEADRARWEADVRACQAGDRTRCAPAPGQVPPL